MWLGGKRGKYVHAIIGLVKLWYFTNHRFSCIKGYLPFPETKKLPGICRGNYRPWCFRFARWEIWPAKSVMDLRWWDLNGTLEMAMENQQFSIGTRYIIIQGPFVPWSCLVQRVHLFHCHVSQAECRNENSLCPKYDFLKNVRDTIGRIQQKKETVIASF